MTYCTICKREAPFCCDYPEPVHVPDYYPKDDLVYRYLRRFGLTDLLQRRFPDIVAAEELHA